MNGEVREEVRGGGGGSPAERVVAGRPGRLVIRGGLSDSAPHRYVVRRRVERARELLQRSDLSVGDVAGVVGFAHQSHLARHIRRRFGVAPSALRR